MKKIVGASLLGVMVAIGAVAIAQTPSPQERQGRPGKPFGKMHRGAGFGLHKLDLDDAQKQQIKAIHERYAAVNKSARDEMRQLMEQKRQGISTAENDARLQTLRTQLFESHQQMREEVLGVLTAEQRQQLEQMRQERRQRMEQRMQRRGRPAPQS